MATRYRFVKGNGDAQQAAELDKASEEGYKAKLMVCDSSHIGTDSNQQFVVLMEKTPDIDEVF